MKHALSCPHTLTLICISEQHGMCRVLSYLIQSLSAERAFGLKLSSPIKAQVPQKYAAMGTAADFMIQVSFPSSLSKRFLYSLFA